MQCLRHTLRCRFAQVRARKLAEAAGFVNELLLKATSLVSTALAAEGAEAEGVQALLTKVCAVLKTWQQPAKGWSVCIIPLKADASWKSSH